MNNNKMDFGVKALILKDNKFLAMHNNGVKEDLWELPGGRMEFGETAEETLKREIMEETGLIVKPIKLLDTWNLMLREDYQIAGIIYLCQLEEGEVKLSDEHDAFKWIGTDMESLNYMYPVFRIKMMDWNWDEIRDITVEKSKRAYIGIKYHENYNNKDIVDKISSVLERRGYETSCIVRDLESNKTYNPRELMELTFKEIDECDLVIIDLSEKGVGLGIEAGYAFAKNIPVITIAKQGSDISETLEGISKDVFFYKDIDDIDIIFNKL